MEDKNLEVGRVKAFLTPAEQRTFFNNNVTNYVNTVLYRFYYMAKNIIPVSET